MKETFLKPFLILSINGNAVEELVRVGNITPTTEDNTQQKKRPHCSSPPPPPRHLSSKRKKFVAVKSETLSIIVS
jgi:hypothetical protein